jgi:uncharacterized protein YhaN
MATKVKKLSKEELEQIQVAVNTLARAKQNLGEMEYQKSQMISNIMKFEAEVKVVQQELEEKYGQVTIDLNTGEYQETAEAAE